MIDDNQHYAEIQRLTETKNQMQRQVLVEPIIYHQAYPQEMEMSHQSHGRMVNENSYPVIAPQNIQNQQIPVGRPLFMGNPYNNQRIYRANQFWAKLIHFVWSITFWFWNNFFELTIAFENIFLINGVVVIIILLEMKRGVR